MKKILSLLLIIILVTGLVGCGNSTKTKAVDQGKIALENKEYDKALSSFEIALNEDESDVKIKEIRDIIKGYKDAEEYLEDEDIKKAEKTLNNIDSAYSRYPIKEDIDKLKAEVNNMKDTIAQEEKEEKEKAEKAEEEKTAKEEQVKQDQINKENQDKIETVKQETTTKSASKRSEYLQKLNTIDFREDEIRRNSDFEPERVTQSYELWDNFLNEIWGVLQKQLSKGEMDSLRKVQRQWIKDKEANQKSIYDNGGNTSSAVGETLRRTRIRSRELIEGYMR